MSQKVKKRVPKLRFSEFEGDWNELTISRIGEVIRGASPRPKGDKRYYGGKIPRLMVEDVTRDGKYVTPRTDFLTEEGAKLSRLCEKGTLTIVCSGTVGIPSFLAVDACIHDGFLAIRNLNKEVVNEDFLYHQLATLRNVFESSATHGGVFTNLTTEILKNFKIELTSIAEQEKVASFLGAIATRLTQLRHKRELLQTYKRGVMQKIFSQQVRFRGAIGSDFPDWEKKDFGDIATKISSKYDPTASDTIYSCIELESIAPNEGKLIKIFDSKEQQSIKNKFKSEDVLFGKLRPYLRKFVFAEFEGVCSTEIWVLRGKKLSSKYLYYLVQSDKFYKISNVTFGSKMPRSDWDFISAFSFEFPCKKEQEKITDFLTAIDQKIEAISRQIDRTEQFKKGLLQKMFV